MKQVFRQLFGFVRDVAVDKNCISFTAHTTQLQQIMF